MSKSRVSLKKNIESLKRANEAANLIGVFGVFCLTPLFTALHCGRARLEMRIKAFCRSVLSTTRCGNFDDDVSVNQWLTRNFSKVRKPSKCYDKSFCLSDKPFSNHICFIVCFFLIRN
jgi:hypothetical protein